MRNPEISESEDAEYRTRDDVIEWHGWAKGDVALHVGPLPGRKSLALYLRAKTVVTVLAYFRTEDEARRCMRWLDGDLDADTVIAEVMGRPS